jgi:hypothetical protein
MSIHYAKIDKSAALQRILCLLKERGDVGATTWEIITECRVANPPTRISELRKNGYDISTDAERVDGRTLYRYRLRKATECDTLRNPNPSKSRGLDGNFSIDNPTESDTLPSTVCMGKPGAEGPGSSVLIVASRDDSPRKSSPCANPLGLDIPARYVDPVDTVNKGRRHAR